MYNILIADDEFRVCAGLRVIIDWEAFGFRVLETAEDGEDALEKLKRGRYNLVITDIRMPVIDGLELIKCIQDYNPDIKIIIISGYNDFKYAKKAIELGVKGYLLKPVNREELQQHIIKIREELDSEYSSLLKKRENHSMGLEKVLFDLAMGNLSQQDISGKAEEYGLRLDGSCFTAALIEIENFFHILEVNLEDANLVKFSVKNISEEIVNETGRGYVYGDLYGKLGIIFCGDLGEAGSQAIFECLKRIYDSVNKYLKININIGYGSTVKSALEIKNSRRQAQEALDRGLVMEKERIVAYDVKVLNEKSVLDLKWNNEKLLQCIEVADMRGVEGELEGLAAEIGRKCFPKELVRGILYNIILGVSTVIKSNNGNAGELFSQEELDVYGIDYANCARLKEWLASVCRKTCCYILELQNSKSSNVFSQIKKYIDSNYYRDLSLKYMAEVFYMSPAYLGRLFKNNMGENFNDYLNKVRISEVKKRFFQEEGKIYDIIEKVGYSSHENFYRQFKRYEGKSFAEYKEGLKSELNTIK